MRTTPLMIVLLAVPAPAMAQGWMDQVLASTRLPVAAADARDAGVPSPLVQQLLNALHRSGLPPEDGVSRAPGGDTRGPRGRPHGELRRVRPVPARCRSPRPGTGRGDPGRAPPHGHRPSRRQRPRQQAREERCPGPCAAPARCRAPENPMPRPESPTPRPSSPASHRRTLPKREGGGSHEPPFPARDVPHRRCSSASPARRGRSPPRRPRPALVGMWTAPSR